MSNDLVAAFVDYENIRRRLRANFSEDISAKRIVEAIGKVAEEIGKLYEGRVFGDWTLRPEDARSIESLPTFRVELVLRSDSKQDRTDPRMSFAIDDMLRERSNIRNFLICAGDSGYCEVIRRGRSQAKNMYVCAVGADVARQLVELATAFYPIEQRLDLQSRDAQQLALSGLESGQIERWRPLVKQLERAEKSLPYVVRSHFCNNWLQPALGYGHTFEEKNNTIQLAIDLGLLTGDTVQHPETGKPVRTIRPNRESPVVQAILLTTSGA